MSTSFAFANDLAFTGLFPYPLISGPWSILIKEIASFIEKRYLTRKGSRQTTPLLVNGTKVPLKDFIQEALAETVHGFVKTLKFHNDIKDIEQRIKLEE